MIEGLDRLAERIEQEKAAKVNTLAAGALDHEAYKVACGYLAALAHVSAWIEETKKDVLEG